MEQRRRLDGRQTGWERVIWAAIAGILVAWPVGAADIGGTWTARVRDRQGNWETLRMTFACDGNTLTGTVRGWGGEREISDGVLDGDDISFEVVRDGGDWIDEYEGYIEDRDLIQFSVRSRRAGGSGAPTHFEARHVGGAADCGKKGLHNQT